MAQNLPPNILADQALTTMKLTRLQSRHANSVTQESTVRDMVVCGPTVFVTRGSSALVAHGQSVLEILVHPTITMQRALLTAAILNLSVFAQHGTRQQVEHS